ncbi:Armadillo-like helical [Penicillium chermesinum]|uniref:Armadillo-like helical n=1 Tax=Penicillium chermesinum TaxID=63820 RepID=A0A9W9TRA2_9EURO|nr:Armadillo-like helical [Penicillium chermesinum]KAJ5238495.1 Armadillo-like helical [Penicillium chermesinum]
MENVRQESFKQLRAPCVELSAAGLAFRGNNASADDVIRAAEPVYRVLEDLSRKHALDEKMAEYAFFPLSHIFNETKRLPARCLELAIKSLRILVEDGYGRKLAPAMGKQLIILLTLIVGGSPNKANGEPLRPQVVEELSLAGFDCLRAIFDVLEGSVAEKTIYHEIGTATIVDQTVYILLEGLVDEHSDALCLAAARALHSLYNRISDRVVLASIMPRTVSALVKVIKPSTQVRRSYKLVESCLQTMTRLIRTVISDKAAVGTKKADPTLPQSERPTLDASWLKATTTQVKLALANVIQIRRHQRQEVQLALLDLCVMVIEDCQSTLHEALPLMIETAVVLADKEEETSNDAYKAIMHLTTTYSVVVDVLKESLHGWLTSFPRIMQNNDETAKQWAIRQIATAFQILTQVQPGSSVLSSNLASGLCDSVGAVVKLSTSSQQLVASTAVSDSNLDVIISEPKALEFPPVLLEHRSQGKTLSDLRSMIVKLNASDSGNDITRLIMNRVHAVSDEATVGPFWLALTSLRAQSSSASFFDDFLADDQVDQSMLQANRRAMIEELYYNSLVILTDLPPDGSGDWRTLALSLEAVALQAQQLGEAFRQS